MLRPQTFRLLSVVLAVWTTSLSIIYLKSQRLRLSDILIDPNEYSKMEASDLIISVI